MTRRAVNRAQSAVLLIVSNSANGLLSKWRVPSGEIRQAAVHSASTALDPDPVTRGCQIKCPLALDAATPLLGAAHHLAYECWWAASLRSLVWGATVSLSPLTAGYTGTWNISAN